MKLGFFHVLVVENGKELYKKVWYTCKVVVLLFKPIALMTFSLSSLSSDLKVPIVFVTWCYHTPFSIKELAHSLSSYSISSVKDVIVFPSFHIFALVDGQKRTRILYVWMRFQKRRESLVRCGRGLNINYVLICMVNFMYFNNRLPTYPKI